MSFFTAGLMFTAICASLIAVLIIIFVYRHFGKAQQKLVVYNNKTADKSFDFFEATMVVIILGTVGSFFAALICFAIALYYHVT